MYSTHDCNPLSMFIVAILLPRIVTFIIENS